MVTRSITAAVLCVICMAGTSPVSAYAGDAQFDIPAQPMPLALKVFAAQAQMQLFYVYPAIEAARGNPLQGELNKRRALEELLRGSGLEAVFSSDDHATIRQIKTFLSRPEGWAGDLNRGDSLQQDGDAISGGPKLGSGSPSGADSQLQEVIVTAEKRDARIQDVPIPVTALGGSTLAETSNFRIQDYYTQVPGLALTPNEGYGASTIAIRGITSGDTANPTVGVTVDDVPFGSSTSIGLGFLAPDLDPSDLARIEVLRGPQGTLYGASSIGGLLKYVTTDPTTTALTGRIQSGLSSVAHGGEAGYHVSGAINVPVSDTSAIRASAFTRREPGYIDNVQAGERDVNRTEVFGSHLSALWHPSTSFSLKLSALFQSNKIFGSPYAVSGPGLEKLEQTFLPRTGRVERKFAAYSAVATGDLGPFKLVSVTGYSVSRMSDLLDSSLLYAPVVAPVFPDAAGTAYDENSQTTKVSQEIRLTSSLGSHFEWLVGGFYAHENSPGAANYIPLDANSHPLISPLSAFARFTTATTYAEWAAFTDLTYHLTDQFDVQIGGRGSLIRQTYGGVDSGLYVPIYELVPSPNVTPESATREHAFTYLLTPRFKITPDIMVYGRFASGFRPGGINIAYEALGLPQDFAPDKTSNYEIGIKGETLNHRLSFDSSLYYIDWQNIQLSLTNANGQNYFANGGEAKSEGIELSAQIVPMSGMRVGAWASLSHAVLTRDMPASSTAFGLAGDRLPYSSRLSGSAYFDCDFPVGRFVGSYGATVSYVGVRTGNFVQTPERQTLAGYTKIDLRAGAKFNSWSVDVYVNNAADRRGVTGGGLGTSVPIAFALIQPRTVGVSAVKTL